MQIFSGVIGLIVILFLVVLAVLWCVLPFAVFGIKDRLDKLIKEMQAIKEATALTQYEIRKTNKILSVVHNVEEQ